jgi:hypothetical protein
LPTGLETEWRGQDYCSVRIGSGARKTGAIAMDGRIDTSLAIDHRDQLWLLEEAIEQFLDRLPPTRVPRLRQQGQALLSQITNLSRTLQVDEQTPAS